MEIGKNFIQGIGVAIDEQYKPLEQQLHLEIVRGLSLC